METPLYESATLQGCSVALCVSLRGNIVEKSLFFLGIEEAVVGVSRGTIGEMREKGKGGGDVSRMWERVRGE